MEHANVLKYWETNQEVKFGAQEEAATIGILCGKMPGRVSYEHFRKARNEWALKTGADASNSKGWRGMLFMVDNQNDLLVIPRLSHERSPTLKPLDLRTLLENCCPLSLRDFTAKKKNEKRRGKGQ